MSRKVAPALIYRPAVSLVIWPMMAQGLLVFVLQPATCLMSGAVRGLPNVM